MATIYYTDKLGSNLNIFEKKTKGGEPFYYIYLDKTKITEGDVGKLTRIMQDVIPNGNIKTKKGKIAYQVSWSLKAPIPQNLFDEIFSWLKSYGYVDAYQPKATRTKNPISTTSLIAYVPLGKTKFEVGDVFKYIGAPNSSIDSTEYIVTKIEDEYIYIKNNELPNAQSFYWVGVYYGEELIKEGKIQFINVATSPNSTTPPAQIAKIPKQYEPELDVLKQKLSDLIFLKSILSDLDFEQNINISTEIFDVQYKIDTINAKIFEQLVNESDFFDNLFEQSFTPLKSRYDSDIVKNEIEEFISPSGQTSDFNQEMLDILNSKEFKNWFGDWRNAFFYRNLEDFGGLNISKVLNDKFEPQLVWHGTNNEFSYFKFDLFPANYFSVNREYSEFFARNKGGEGLVLPFFLNIKNPLDLSHFGNNRIRQEQFFDWIYLTIGMTPEELDVNPMFLDTNIPPQPIWMYIRNNPTMLKKIAQGKVYDGVKFYEFNPNERDNPDKKAYETLAYLVFDSHQVKLADSKRGNILLANLKSFMLNKGGKI
jgi:hypothetical protein